VTTSGAAATRGSAAQVIPAAAEMDARGRGVLRIMRRWRRISSPGGSSTSGDSNRDSSSGASVVSGNVIPVDAAFVDMSSSVGGSTA